MPVTEQTVLAIVCDNPACPGNTLPTDDRQGWTFVTTEVYGSLVQQFVYCSPSCTGSIEAPLAEDEAARAEAAAAEVDGAEAEPAAPKRRSR